MVIIIYLKWSSLIQRVGRQNIGFYCWNIFIINSFRGYEVIVFCLWLYFTNTLFSLIKPVKLPNYLIFIELLSIFVVDFDNDRYFIHQNNRNVLF